MVGRISQQHNGQSNASYVIFTLYFKQELVALMEDKEEEVEVIKTVEKEQSTEAEV